MGTMKFSTRCRREPSSLRRCPRVHYMSHHVSLPILHFVSSSTLITVIWMSSVTHDTQPSSLLYLAPLMSGLALECPGTFAVPFHSVLLLCAEPLGRSELLTLLSTGIDLRFPSRRTLLSACSCPFKQASTFLALLAHLLLLLGRSRFASHLRSSRSAGLDRSHPLLPQLGLPGLDGPDIFGSCLSVLR